MKLPDPLNQIVLITHPDKYHGMYGTIVAIYPDEHPDGPYEVRFGKEYRWKFGAGFGTDNLVRFAAEDFVMVYEMPGPVKAKAIAAMGTAHTVNYFTKLFRPGGRCQHEACHELATGRIFVNHWGTVTEVETCDAHQKQFENVSGDHFPFTRPQGGAHVVAHASV